MKDFPLWDAKYRRPIVDGKVANPVTGAIEPAATEGYTSGPPTVDGIWIDMIAGVVIAKHVEERVYTIVSLQASAYSVTTVCETLKPAAEFYAAMRRMNAALPDHIGVSVAPEV